MSNTAKTVLILEDQPLIALDIEELLFESGFKNVSLVSSCADAEDWLQTNQPDVAILDINLRDGICVEVAKTLVECDVPFVVHTGSDPSVADDNVVFLKGRWIGKPSQPSLLLDAVHDLLGQTESSPSRSKKGD